MNESLTSRLTDRNIPAEVRMLCIEAACRIEELELNNKLARNKFFADNTDSKAAVEMLKVLHLID